MTPADRAPSVAVFGTGIAGLTAAHELAERGFRVLVVEPPNEDDAAGSDGAMDVPLLLPTPCRHLLDTMKRIPLEAQPDGVERSFYDDVVATRFEAVSKGAHVPFVFSPSRSASVGERYDRFRELLGSKLSTQDIQALFLRMLKYHTTSSERRRKECETLSFLEYLEGRDASALPPYRLSEAVVARLKAELLAAFGLDASWCDARSVWSLLVQFHLGARSEPASGFLEVSRAKWQRAWKEQLLSLGVDFRSGTLTGLRGRPGDPIELEVHWHGTPPPPEYYPCDYQVIATDVVTAERISAPLEAETGVPGELQGFTTVLRSNPRTAEQSRYVGRDPTLVRNVGAKEWDRLRFEMTVFLTLPLELPLLAGHLSHVDSAWAIQTSCSTTSQEDAEEKRSFVVATIHDVRAPASVGPRQGKSALDCTPQEIAK